MSLDTVARAAETPETEQPYADLGLKPDEYARIREILGRRPMAWASSSLPYAPWSRQPETSAPMRWSSSRVPTASLT